ncbi:hypothetical protein [Desulfitobacterium sp.]|uniref:hypothetical protein n=1 Tax=Desulfitobacterium sp. TaxID=49981 RepID=UPI002B1F7B2A|nr:hypothetical protein [Desulfitobacterium sp.]MEA4901536.1 hypothetical protein [Desulfitobacterium sp.]
MGHYCRICGRIRANEKFSGKGHKNHICKDCSGKSGKKAKRNGSTENAFTSETMVPSNDVLIPSKIMHFDGNRFSEIDVEKQNVDDDELPF